MGATGSASWFPSHDHYGIDENNPLNGGIWTEPTESPVKLRTVDSSFYFLERLDFIKIDVEGMELDVLRGATKTLNRLRPIIVFETHYEYQEARDPEMFAKIFKLFEDLDYDVLNWAEGKLEPAKPDNLEPDTIAVPR